jgi:hypothetical protein
MQICGQEVNIEDLKTKTAELAELMSDPEVLAAIEAKVAEANEKLADFKPEIPRLPNLQEALAELNEELSSEEFAQKISQIKQDFGEAVDNLDEILDKANAKLNEFLAELPTNEDLAKLTDGSLVGDALAELNAKLAEAELKLQKKIAIEGKPTIDLNTLCEEVPNIEVETKTIDVQEVRNKIINGEPVVDGATGAPVKETVTVQKEVKQKVELPAEPVVPKEVPVKSEPKPVQTTRTVDPSLVAEKVLRRAGSAAVKEVRQDIQKIAKDRKEFRIITQSYVHFYYIEVARTVGVAGNTNAEIQANAVKRKMRAKWGLATDLAETYVAEADRKRVFNIVKSLYESDAIAETVSFEEALANYARLR